MRRHGGEVLKLGLFLRCRNKLNRHYQQLVRVEEIEPTLLFKLIAQRNLHLKLDAIERL
jgi:hypothetical protein